MTVEAGKTLGTDGAPLQTDKSLAHRSFADPSGNINDTEYIIEKTHKVLTYALYEKTPQKI